MSKIEVIYCSCMCSEKTYEKWFLNSELKPGQQVQKYHRVMLKGLAQQEDVCVRALSKLPISNNDCKKKYIYSFEEVWEGVKIKYFPIVNMGILGRLFQIVTSFFEIIRESQAKNKVVILDVLNISMGLGIVCACKLKKIKIIGIVTDLPEMLVEDTNSVFVKKCGKIIENCSGYLLLTEEMNKIVNPTGKKPYIVIEGQVDSEMKEMVNKIENKYDKKICMYSGNLNRVHGIEYLVKGFIKANISEAELHIYGDGDYVSELKEICKTNKKVKYGGVKLNYEIVAEQIKATLLINPRPTDQEFVKYSFPSKNMEYMASGTPMLTTCLPGMPEEYYPYVYLISEETVDGISKDLKNILEKDILELHEKGQEARRFVLENKTGNKQAGKLVALIKKVL